MRISGYSSLPVPARPSGDCGCPRGPQDELTPAPRDDDEEKLKRTFLWSFVGAGATAATTLACTAAYASGGHPLGFPVAAGLTLAGGVAGALLLGPELDSSKKHLMGFSAGAGALALAATFGASAGLSSSPAFAGLAAAGAAGAFGFLYGGFGALILT